MALLYPGGAALESLVVVIDKFARRPELALMGLYRLRGLRAVLDIAIIFYKIALTARELIRLRHADTVSILAFFRTLTEQPLVKKSKIFGQLELVPRYKELKRLFERSVEEAAQLGVQLSVETVSAEDLNVHLQPVRDLLAMGDDVGEDVTVPQTIEALESFTDLLRLFAKLHNFAPQTNPNHAFYGKEEFIDTLNEAQASYTTTCIRLDDAVSAIEQGLRPGEHSTMELYKAGLKVESAFLELLRLELEHGYIRGFISPHGLNAQVESFVSAYYNQSYSVFNNMLTGKNALYTKATTLSKTNPLVNGAVPQEVTKLQEKLAKAAKFPEACIREVRASLAVWSCYTIEANARHTRSTQYAFEDGTLALNPFPVRVPPPVLPEDEHAVEAEDAEEAEDEPEDEDDGGAGEAMDEDGEADHHHHHHHHINDEDPAYDLDDHPVAAAAPAAQQVVDIDDGSDVEGPAAAGAEAEAEADDDGDWPVAPAAAAGGGAGAGGAAADPADPAADDDDEWEQLPPGHEATWVTYVDPTVPVPAAVVEAVAQTIPPHLVHIIAGNHGDEDGVERCVVCQSHPARFLQCTPGNFHCCFGCVAELHARRRTPHAPTKCPACKIRLL